MKKQNLSETIEQLGYDFKHFDLQDFIEHIQNRRRREIILAAFPFAHELSGIWVRAETADYLYNAT